MRARERYGFFLFPLMFLCLLAYQMSAGQGDPVKTQSVNPDYDASIKNGSDLLKGGMYEDAVLEFKNAIRLSDGKHYEPYYLLAQTYNLLNDKLNSLESCDRMIALAPTDTIRSLGHNLEGLVLAKSGAKDPASLALAESEFRAALILDPTDAEIHYNLGNTLSVEKRDDDAAVELKAYLAVSPDGRYAVDARQMLPGAVSDSQSDSMLVGDFSPDPSNTKEDAAPSAKPPPGASAPGFSFKTLEGKRVSSSELRGKVILIDFWATWCGACKAAYPDLEVLYDAVDKTKVVVIGVSVDENEAKWRNFLDANSPQWTQTRDDDHKMRRAFVTPLYGIPSYILIDGNGVIRERFTGWSAPFGARLAAGIIRWAKALPAGSSAPAPKSPE
jgi:thiol-disulfide isomerase/thioredoxin